MCKEIQDWFSDWCAYLLQALISSAFADSFDHEWMVRNWTDLNIDFFKNLPAIAGVLLPCSGPRVRNHVPFFERRTDRVSVSDVMSNTMQTETWWSDACIFQYMLPHSHHADPFLRIAEAMPK
jgi:hypothetical protein